MAQEMEFADKNCPTCNSSAHVNPEDVVLTCQYCGTSFTIGEQKIGDHSYVRPTVSTTEAETIIYNYLKEKTRFRGFSSYGGMTAQKMLVPYWLVKSHAISHFRGYKQTTRDKKESYTDSEGNRRTKTTQVTVYEPVNSKIDEHRSDPYLCRMGATIFGQKKLANQVTNAVNKELLESYDPKNLKDEPEKIAYLSGEIKKFEAKELVETRIQDDHRSRAHAATTELFDCRTQISIDGMVFLHYPVVLAEYTFGKETYRVLMDANTGEILTAELPITTRLRIISTIVTFVSMFAVVGLWFGFLAAEEPGGPEYVMAIVMILFILLGLKANATAWSVSSRDE